jgi:hypothetical protein
MNVRLEARKRGGPNRSQESEHAPHLARAQHHGRGTGKLFFKRVDSLID